MLLTSEKGGHVPLVAVPELPDGLLGDLFHHPHHQLGEVHSSDGLAVALPVGRRGQLVGGGQGHLVGRPIGQGAVVKLAPGGEGGDLPRQPAPVQRGMLRQQGLHAPPGGVVRRIDGRAPGAGEAVVLSRGHLGLVAEKAQGLKLVILTQRVLAQRGDAGRDDQLGQGRIVDGPVSDAH